MRRRRRRREALIWAKLHELLSSVAGDPARSRVISGIPAWLPAREEDKVQACLIFLSCCSCDAELRLTQTKASTFFFLFCLFCGLCVVQSITGFTQ